MNYSFNSVRVINGLLLKGKYIDRDNRVTLDVYIYTAFGAFFGTLNSPDIGFSEGRHPLN